jgi:polysaccharide biosynthesis/export protein
VTDLAAAISVRRVVAGRFLFAALCALALGACSLPRGAAVQSEVLRGSGSEARTFSVEPVNGERLALLSGWPVAAVPGSDETWLQRNPGPMTPVIRPGDRVSLTIWDNNENSLLTAGGTRVVSIENVTVGTSGTMFVPYLGEIVVNGLTPDQARRRIQEQLQSILPAAQVLLTVEGGRASSVTLIGGVARPGSYRLPDRNYSVLSVISEAGGVPATLTNPRVRLVRDGRTYGISMTELLTDPGRLDVTLHGGDQVLVQPDRRSFIALGASGRQDVVTFPQDRVTALEAVALIGGLAPTRANLQGVLILREFPETAVRGPTDPETRGPDRRQVVFTLDLTSTDGLFSARQFQIQPGDTVLVTESPVNALRTVLQLIGQGFGLANTISD